MFSAIENIYSTIIMLIDMYYYRKRLMVRYKRIRYYRRHGKLKTLSVKPKPKPIPKQLFPLDLPSKPKDVDPETFMINQYVTESFMLDLKLHNIDIIAKTWDGPEMFLIHLEHKGVNRRVNIRVRIGLTTHKELQDYLNMFLYQIHEDKLVSLFNLDIRSTLRHLRNLEVHVSATKIDGVINLQFKHQDCSEYRTITDMITQKNLTNLMIDTSYKMMSKKY